MALLVALALLANACGDGYSRADAVTELVLAGSTTAEATCIADTLLLLDELEIVHPSTSRTPVDIDVLVRASSRCASQSVSSEATASNGAAEVAPLDVEGAAVSGSPAPSNAAVLGATEQADTGVLAEIRAGAISKLVLVGRTEAFATCVADHLILVDAVDVLAEPDFGVGRFPLEADAYATCT